MRMTALGLVLCTLLTCTSDRSQDGAGPHEKHAARAADHLERYTHSRLRMGVRFRLVFYARTADEARAAANAVFDRLKQLDAALSDWDRDSELMQICRRSGDGRYHAVSPDLGAVLLRSEKLTQASGGAFDITVGPLVKLWRKARRSKRMPAPDRLAAARQSVGPQHVVLEPKAIRVKLARKGMSLDLGGIAKGYAIDQAIELLRSHGIDRALVDGGGDIGVGRAPPEKRGWRIAIQPLDPKREPDRFLIAENLAVATSGDAWQFVEIDGFRYSHIVDPKTGLGLRDRSSVTVVAGDCTTADGVATAVTVLGPSAGMELVERTPGAAALVVRIENGTAVAHESKRFASLTIEPE